MPETLKLLRKRSKVKTWFRDISRETVAGDYLPESEESAQQQDSASTSSTVDPFQGYPTLPSNQYPGYPTLPSDKSDTEQDRMAEREILEAIRRELQQWLVNSAEQKSKTEVLKQELKNVKQKEVDKAKTWEESAILETHDPIAKVVAKLEKQKKPDRSLAYLEILRVEVDAWGIDQNMYAELSKAEEAFSKKMREFNRYAPPYDGNPRTGSSGVRN